MNDEFVKIVERDESVLFVTLISRGLQRERFRRGLGWDCGIAQHKYEKGAHFISRPDFAGIRMLVSEGIKSDQQFLKRYIDRCHTQGSGLINVARELAVLPADLGRDRLIDQFVRFCETTKDTLPSMLATVVVENCLEPIVLASLAREVGGPDAEKRARMILPDLLVPLEQTEAAKEIRSCYELALAVLAVPPLTVAMRDQSVEVCLETIEGSYPEISGAISTHLQQYGWLRTHGYRFEPLTNRELVERLQVIIRRWDRDKIGAIVAKRDLFDLRVVLGFPPSPQLADLVQQLRHLINLRFFRIDVHLRADVIARPFMHQVAHALSCSRDELIFASEDEIIEALRLKQHFPKEKVIDRARNWFAVYRNDDQLEVASYVTPFREVEAQPAGNRVLTGTAACLGRARGKAKVVFAAPEMGKVDIGDILVTTMTTPDLMLAIEQAAAIVTDEGGILSHAAIISRELGIPCVIGTGNATCTFRDGDYLDVDANEQAGIVTRIYEASP
jgi:phosphohistidine swiveling domain-containing protein